MKRLACVRSDEIDSSSGNAQCIEWFRVIGTQELSSIRMKKLRDCRGAVDSGCMKISTALDVKDHGIYGGRMTPLCKQKRDRGRAKPKEEREGHAGAHSLRQAPLVTSMYTVDWLC